MRAMVVLGGLLVLSACGGGGTSGTNYSEAPPVAEIVATPSARASETPEAVPAENLAVEAEARDENAVTNIDAM